MLAFCIVCVFIKDRLSFAVPVSWTQTVLPKWCTWLHKGDNYLISGSQTLVACSGASPFPSFEAVARFSLLQPWLCCVGEVINPTSNYQRGLGGGALHQKLIWLRTPAGPNALGHYTGLQITSMISFSVLFQGHLGHQNVYQSDTLSELFYSFFQPELLIDTGSICRSDHQQMVLINLQFPVIWTNIIRSYRLKTRRLFWNVPMLNWNKCQQRRFWVKTSVTNQLMELDPWTHLLHFCALKSLIW